MYYYYCTCIIIITQCNYFLQYYFY